MVAVEGKISVWIKSGSFSHASDLYIQVLIDDHNIWKTDEKDGYSPDWDSTCVKHIKGEYEKLFIKLMDEDTFSRDDVVAQAEFDIDSIVGYGADGINESVELLDTDGNSVGTVDISISFEEGDVGMFDMFSSMLHQGE